MTMAQPWLKEGMEKGRTEGRTQTLLDQLALKFGPVSAEIRSRVLAAGEPELTRWIGGILRAQSLDELFN